METVALIGAPFALLALFTLTGFGPAVALGNRLPADAQAALAPLLGFAILATSSTLLVTGAPARLVGLLALVFPLFLTIALRKQVSSALRGGARPLAVAAVALVLAGAPSFAHGNWTAKSYLGNTDSYYWVSQARSLFESPPPAPSSLYPDRLAYERTTQQHWALALPLATGEVAWLSGSDPVDVYGLIAAFVAGLIPLAAYFCARACLEWRPTRALVVGLALAANSSLLFASYFSWQQQLVGTALAFAALTAFRLGLERGGSRRAQILAAVLAAGALASYRMALAPYLAGMLVVVLASYLASHGGRRRREALRSATEFSVVFVVLALPSFVALGLGMWRFLTLSVNTSFKGSFPGGNLSETMGLFPRMFGGPAGWGLVAAVVTTVLLLVALLGLRRSGAPRVDFLYGATLVLLAMYALMLEAPGPPPYVTFKLLSYGVPFFALVVFGAGWLAAPSRRRTAGVTALAALTIASASFAILVGARDSRSARDLAGLADVAPRLEGHVVSVRIDDPWEQAWAVYYLRDVPLSVERPSFVLVAVGMRRSPGVYHHPGARYALTSGDGGATWTENGVALSPTGSGLLAGRSS